MRIALIPLWYPQPKTSLSALARKEGGPIEFVMAIESKTYDER